MHMYGITLCAPLQSLVNWPKRDTASLINCVFFSAIFVMEAGQGALASKVCDLKILMMVSYHRVFERDW